MKCVPTWCCKSIYTLDLNKLKALNIKYIFTDLDNTLVPYNVAEPTKEVLELVKAIKNHGIMLVIVSNNTGKRVSLFSQNLGVPHISGAKKPFTYKLRQYLEDNKIDINDCIIIGDQMVTDIRCANKLNCKCILTDPLSERESIVTFLNRKIDSYYRKKYNLVKSCKRMDRSDR